MNSLLDWLLNVFLYGYTRKEDCWTIIHGRRYDLSNFNHPGGTSALSLAFGRDSSILFESYHIVGDGSVSTLKTLPSTPLNEKSLAFSFSTLDSIIWSDAFASELSDMARSYFRENNVSPFASSSRLALLSCFLGFFLFMGYFYYTGWWFSLILFPISSWLFGVNVQHDASHRALFQRQWMNDVAQLSTLFFTSPFMWAHQHVIGHHGSPNTVRDPDLQHGAFAWRYHPDTKYRWWFRYQLKYVFFLWALSVLALAYTWDALSLCTGKYRNTVRLRSIPFPSLLVHVIERLISLTIVFIVPFALFPWYKACVWGVTWYLILGFIFTAISQVNHISPQVLLAKDNRWYRSQVITALNYAKDSTIAFYFTGGLNFQIEHHLFPGINHEHLPNLSKGVQLLCDKYDVQYVYEKTYWDALMLHIEVLSENSYKKSDD